MKQNPPFRNKCCWILIFSALLGPFGRAEQTSLLCASSLRPSPSSGSEVVQAHSKTIADIVSVLRRNAELVSQSQGLSSGVQPNLLPQLLRETKLHLDKNFGLEVSNTILREVRKQYLQQRSSDSVVRAATEYSLEATPQLIFAPALEYQLADFGVDLKAFSFSEKGNFLAAGSNTAAGRGLLVWNLQDPEPQSVVLEKNPIIFNGHSKIQFGADQQTLIVGSEYSLKKYKPLVSKSGVEILGVNDGISLAGFSFSKDLQAMMVFGNKGTMKVVDPAGTELLNFPKMHQIRTAELSPRGDRASSISGDGKILSVWDLEIARVEREKERIQAQKSKVQRVFGQLKGLSEAPKERLFQVKALKEEWQSVEFSSDGTQILAMDKNQGHVFDTSTGEKISSFRAENHWGLAHFSTDGKKVAFLTKSGEVHIVSSSNGTLRSRINIDSFEGEVKLNFTKDGETLIVEKEFGGAQVFDLGSKKMILNMPLSQGHWKQIEKVPELERYIGLSSKGELKTWSLQTGKEEKIADKVSHFGISSDTGRMVVSRDHGKVEMWRLVGKLRPTL